MYLTPYLNFNGNCAEAVALYEKALGVKAEVLRYKDAPQSEGYVTAPGTEDFVMHATIEIERGQLYLSDCPPEHKVTFGNAVSVSLELESCDKIREAFKVLAEGGSVHMEPQKSFFSECFGMLTDKFGVNWMLMKAE